MPVVSALVWLALAQAPQAVAVEPAAAPATEAAACPATEAPVVEIGARIKARSLKFTQAGDGEARVYADPGGEGEWKLDRGPLPDPIPVGKTFRNVDVTLDARADLTSEGLAIDAAAGPTAERLATEPAAACN